MSLFVMEQYVRQFSLFPAAVLQGLPQTPLETNMVSESDEKSSSESLSICLRARVSLVLIRHNH